MVITLFIKIVLPPKCSYLFEVMALFIFLGGALWVHETKSSENHEYVSAIYNTKHQNSIV